ncbi:MAG: radical SAM protein [Planctomycetes bacterium]|nr:radical SAM protein [Planctomycetota bacterium]
MGLRVLIVNPPYQTLTSNLGVGHQIPLGLLMVGGALLDAGHEVKLHDAEARRDSIASVAEQVRRWRADVVMTGHAGSTPAHPVCMAMLRAIRAAYPQAVNIYGGVYPSYHAQAILRDEPAVDVIVRGEGEATSAELLDALEHGKSLDAVEGIAFRRTGDEIVQTPEREPMGELDRWRVGWELIDDWDRYRCFGLGRAAIMQWSRGCPHRCTYCGQHGFWVKWRRRSIVPFVDEIEMLSRVHGVRFITFADENPTTIQDEWRALLTEIARRKLPVKFFATIRATDIVRDAQFIDLYREAGMLYVLMGIESTDDAVLEAVHKRSNTLIDFHACRLLRAHHIYSIIGHIVGLGDETPADFRRARRVLARYDGDYLNAMYVTPHSWTRFAADQAGRGVVQMDQRKWDYRHQVLAQSKMRPWELFLWVKWLELCFHLRPARLRRMLTGDAARRRQMLWCQWHTFMVWLGEIVEFIAATRHEKSPRPLQTVCDLRDERVPLRIRRRVMAITEHKERTTPCIPT